MECLKLNPNIKCVEPDYCFVNYLDGEYKDKNIKVRYSQAVIKEDKPFKEMVCMSARCTRSMAT